MCGAVARFFAELEDRRFVGCGESFDLGEARDAVEIVVGECLDGGVFGFADPGDFEFHPGDLSIRAAWVEDCRGNIHAIGTFHREREKGGRVVARGLAPASQCGAPTGLGRLLGLTPGLRPGLIYAVPAGLGHRELTHRDILPGLARGVGRSLLFWSGD